MQTVFVRALFIYLIFFSKNGTWWGQPLCSRQNISTLWFKQAIEAFRWKQNYQISQTTYCSGCTKEPAGLLEDFEFEFLQINLKNVPSERFFSRTNQEKKKEAGATTRKLPPLSLGSDALLPTGTAGNEEIMRWDYESNIFTISNVKKQMSEFGVKHISFKTVANDKAPEYISSGVHCFASDLLCARHISVGVQNSAHIIAQWCKTQCYPK